jgi:hypothetical protein
VRFGVVGTAPLRSPAFRRWLVAATLVNVCLWTYLTGLTWTILARTDSAATVSLIQTADRDRGAGILADRLTIGRVLLGMSSATLVALLGVVILNRPVWPAIRGRDLLGAEAVDAAADAAVDAATNPGVKPEISSEPAAGS